MTITCKKNQFFFTDLDYMVKKFNFLYIYSKKKKEKNEVHKIPNNYSSTITSLILPNPLQLQQNGRRLKAFYLHICKQNTSQEGSVSFGLLKVLKWQSY